MTAATPQPGDADTAIIDIRSAEDYAHSRARGAVRLTLRELADCAYLLPPRSRPLLVVGDEDDAVRRAVDILQKAERTVRGIVGREWREALPLETGTPSRTALWEPAAIVRRAVDVFRASRTAPPEALDVACGTGRNAVFLAQAGFKVTAVDRLPDALERAQDLARRSGVTIHTHQVDLEQPDVLAPHSADCVVVVRYLDRALFPALRAALRPGGLLVYETFTIEQARMGHPRNPLYMLQPGELARAFADLDILHHDEDWHDGAHTAQLLARRN